jgi:hypothetical protein
MEDIGIFEVRGGPKKLDRKERINSDIKQIKISE